MNSRVLLVTIGLLIGCHRSEPPASTPAPSSTQSVAVKSGAAKTPIRTAPYSFSAQLMGTPFTILIDDPISPEAARKAADLAFTEIARVESIMSEWRPGSEVSAINRAPVGTPVSVSDETLHVIEQSLGLSARSNGAFDVTWAAFRGLWNFQTAKQLPTKDAIRERLLKIGWKHVQVDRNARTITIQKPGIQLGLGGIAKGYGIDRAVAVLKTQGLSRFLINGGGDLVGRGNKRSGDPWMIGVQHPRRTGAMLTRLPVDGHAVVSSGDYERFFEHEGVRYHHILDLKTGYPARASVAVTVKAPNATIADALCTAIFVLGPRKGLALAQQFPGVEAAILAPDGLITRTSGMAAYFPDRWNQR